MAARFSLSCLLYLLSLALLWSIPFSPCEAKEAAGSKTAGRSSGGSNPPPDRGESNYLEEKLQTHLRNIAALEKALKVDLSKLTIITANNPIHKAIQTLQTLQKAINVSNQILKKLQDFVTKEERRLNTLKELQEYIATENRKRQKEPENSSQTTNTVLQDLKNRANTLSRPTPLDLTTEQTKSVLTLALKMEKVSARSTRLEMAFGIKAMGQFQSANVLGEVLQVLGQIVVKRTTQAAFEVVTNLMKDGLKCKQSASPNDPALVFKFVFTCQLLDKIDIKNIVTKPNAILQAVLQDVFENVLERLENHSDPKVQGLGTIIKNVNNIANKLQLRILLRKMVDAWIHSGSDGIAQIVYNHLKQIIIERAQELQCSQINPTGNEAELKPYLQALWVAAQCVIETQKNHSNQFYQKIASCKINEKARNCDPQKAQTIERTAQILLSVLSINPTQVASSDKAATIAKPAIQFFFFVMKELINNPKTQNIELNASIRLGAVKAEVLEMVGGLENIFMGIVEQDWIKVIGGASAMVTAILNIYVKTTQKITINQDGLNALTKCFKLLAAIGQYAATYKKSSRSDSLGDLQKIRQNIIENLIDSVTNRATRDHGFVVSVGGSFGLLGGARLLSLKEGTNQANTKIDVSFSGPFVLPLGFGLQTYGNKNVGFHLQLSFFDIGQYVSFNGASNESIVRIPQFVDAFSISMTLGIWFPRLSKSVPLFLAFHGGVSPFQISNNLPIGYVGVMFGGYVPFFDFN